uniref:JmjC domain-containing protein n=1 Tax=Araucaria cunninghamii TaxID=56994 RepID=A0A0D6R3N9_ARACU
MGETYNGTHDVAKHKHPKTKNRKKRKQNLQETPPYPDLNLNLERSNYGVQPMGNLLFNSDSFNARDVGLGTLTLFKDETLVEIFGLLDAKDLGRLALVSKAMYVFSNQDSLWRALVLDHLKGTFTFQGFWKSTYIAAHWPNTFEALGVPFKVSNFYSDYLFQSWLCANLEMKQEWLEVDNIERREKLPLQEFIDSFEEPNKPVLIRDGLANWAALNKWDREYLCEMAGDVEFAVGPVEMKLRDYFVYADSVKEERPLYLFDPKFGEKVPTLAEDYEIPIYFREDLFSLLGKERPDYRWLILGPARSGSSFHIDPNSTSAWNAVIKGSKKWILFPPDVVPPGVHPSPDGAEVASPVSIIEWFMNFYGETKHWKKRPTECICRAGEVIFVPNGWWHLVINLEDSIAITQNYVSRRNLLNVLDFLSRPNSRELVSGTKDRVNLYDKFRSVYETFKPGSIDELKCKEEEKKN